MTNLKTLMLLPCLILASCSTLNEEFDCPAPQKGSCKRMDQVYEMVNGVGHKQLAAQPNSNPYVVKEQAGKPVRYGKGAMRLWIAPYEDTDGNYHQANQIYSKVQEEPAGKNLALATH